MTTPSQQLKKALVAAGFEVFRTLPSEIVLAERVRENLILDSGVRIAASDNGAFEVRIVMRAQRADFPNDEESVLFNRVRKLAEPALSSGFEETDTQVTAITDPADPSRVLDTFYELRLVRQVASFEDALQVLSFGFSLERAVPATASV